MMAQSDTVAIQVNGNPHTCPKAQYLPSLLLQLDLNPKLIAIEYNGEILHRQFWDETPVREGDRLEIVTIVGGG
ncbi:sulfur carrier protein ThiS [Altericista sp. CCNU0014]|uniref:sulfur carrier protein ThiS n=1 Tax=Altericista sp. CCNU0014 TaxID=3082949 RepID=UPI00384F3349